jgi:hypothetical protein
MQENRRRRGVLFARWISPVSQITRGIYRYIITSAFSEKLPEKYLTLNIINI